jgi:hypothetical protein
MSKVEASSVHSEGRRRSGKGWAVIFVASLFHFSAKRKFVSLGEMKNPRKEMAISSARKEKPSARIYKSLATIFKPSAEMYIPSPSLKCVRARKRRILGNIWRLRGWNVALLQLPACSQVCGYCAGYNISIG